MIDWLLKRGISDEVIARFNVSTDVHPTLNECIRIPIHDSEGTILFSKYRRSPFVDSGNKYMYDVGTQATLYAWHEAKKHKRILITEGELDTLVAWSNNIPAISSTGGCMTFKNEWADLLKDKEVVVCYDNDDAGAKGAVKLLSLIPHAKVLLIPEQPNIKDLTDYCKAGGDIHEFILTAISYTSLEQVKEERGKRLSVFDSVRFHDAYIEKNTPVTHTPRFQKGDTTINRAKSYPITNLVQFDRTKNIKCLWHSERTASLHYYPKTNTAYCFGGCGRAYDAIDFYRAIHNCNFTTAVRELNKLV